MENIDEKIQALETRAEKIRKTVAQIEKTQAVKQHQYDECVKKLAGLGIDVDGMKLSELKKLLAETEEQLKTDMERLDETIAKSEEVIKEFQAAQG